MFTIAFQTLVDLYLDMKLLGYWYFTKEVDWITICGCRQNMGGDPCEQTTGPGHCQSNYVAPWKKY